MEEETASTLWTSLAKEHIFPKNAMEQIDPRKFNVKLDTEIDYLSEGENFVRHKITLAQLLASEQGRRFLAQNKHLEKYEDERVRREEQEQLKREKELRQKDEKTKREQEEKQCQLEKEAQLKKEHEEERIRYEKEVALKKKQELERLQREEEKELKKHRDEEQNRLEENEKITKLQEEEQIQREEKERIDKQEVNKTTDLSLNDDNYSNTPNKDSIVDKAYLEDTEQIESPTN
eukprot:695762_1